MCRACFVDVLVLLSVLCHLEVFAAAAFVPFQTNAVQYINATSRDTSFGSSVALISGTLGSKDYMHTHMFNTCYTLYATC